MGSIAIRIIFYKNVGIILPRTGPSTYMQGFEFAYNITGCKQSSSIKSKPKIYIIFKIPKMHTLFFRDLILLLQNLSNQLQLFSFFVMYPENYTFIH